MPKFSIILPTHNGEGRIRHAVASVHKQTFTDWELIIILDCCDDDTMKDAENEFIDDLNTLRDKVHFVHSGAHNDGLARNHGLDMATGEWVLFLDDDDMFMHEYCFQQIADALTDDIDMLSFSFIIRSVEYFAQSPERYFTSVWAHAWRREFIGDERFKDMEFGSDSEFASRLANKNARIKFWDMPIYYYNFLREGSLTWKKVHT